MTRLTEIRLLTKPELDRFLARTLLWLRWATIGALLLISQAQPGAGRTRLPDWTLVALFGGYNLLLGGLRWWLPLRRAFAWAAVLDLPAVGLVYFNCSQPGGPLFTLLVLAAAQTAAFMTLVGSLLYTAALAAIVLLVEPTLPAWSGTLADMRAMSARLVVLGLVGVGTGTLARRLEREQGAAQSVLGETERLAELDRLRSDFVSTVSHDLRTPLTAARAGLGLLEGSIVAHLAAADRDLLANTRRNVERLNLLIDDLLAYNQLGAGTLRLDLEVIDVRTVISDAIAAVRPLTLAKDQTLVLDLPVVLPCQADAGKLEQVMLNVVANAYHYTPPGTRIAVSGRLIDGDILVSVSDNGPGIPTAELDAIFARFYRLASGAAGSGLGLAVARGIVELHGGTMWAESSPGQGATFHIRLPRANGRSVR